MRVVPQERAAKDWQFAINLHPIVTFVLELFSDTA
jgi:hypothetical protein